MEILIIVIHHFITFPQSRLKTGINTALCARITLVAFSLEIKHKTDFALWYHSIFGNHPVRQLPQTPLNVAKITARYHPPVYWTWHDSTSSEGSVARRLELQEEGESRGFDYHYSNLYGAFQQSSYMTNGSPCWHIDCLSSVCLPIFSFSCQAATWIHYSATYFRFAFLSL